MCPTSFGVAIQQNREQEPNPPEGLASIKVETELAFKTQFQLVES